MPLTSKHKQFFVMTAGALILGAVALMMPHQHHPPQRAVGSQQNRRLDPFTHRYEPEPPQPATCAEFQQYYWDSQKEWDTLGQHPSMLLFGLSVAVAGLLQIARWIRTAWQGLGHLLLYGWGYVKVFR
jgi:hypothetical protein